MSSARIDPPKRVLGLKEGVVTPPQIHGVIGLESSSTGSSFHADSAKPVPLAGPSQCFVLIKHSDFPCSY
ncbi:unnamed protein product [Brassica rapa subsp. narinosa]